MKWGAEFHGCVLLRSRFSRIPEETRGAGG
jgi:hypothetical protein